jgi:hypothetical protein
MPTPRDQRRHRRSTVKPDRVRALELLDGCGDEGCTKASLRAHGFATAEIVELVRGGLATATAEHVVARRRDCVPGNPGEPGRLSQALR